jgi:hypothetical protein
MNNNSSNDKVQKSAGVKGQQIPSIQEKGLLAKPSNEIKDVPPEPATASLTSDSSSGSSLNSPADSDLRRSITRRKGGATEDIASAVPPTKHTSTSSAGKSSVDSSVGAFSVSGSDNSADSVARRKELGSVARRKIGTRPMSTPPATTSLKKDASQQMMARRKGGGTNDTASVVSPATSASRPSGESSDAFSASGSTTPTSTTAQRKGHGVARSHRISEVPPSGATSISGSEDTFQEQRVRTKTRESQAQSNDSILVGAVSIMGLQHSSAQEQTLRNGPRPRKSAKSLPGDVVSMGAVPMSESTTGDGEKVIARKDPPKEDDAIEATSLPLTPRDSVPVVNPSGNARTSTVPGAAGAPTAPGAVAVAGIGGSSADSDFYTDAAMEQSLPPTSPAVQTREETVTAMAVSSEDLEKEVMQRILRESVIANVEYVPEDEEVIRPWYRRYLVILILLILLAAAVVGIIGVLDATQGTPAPAPTIPPTPAPTPAPSTGRPTAAPSFRPSRAPITSQPTAEPVLTPQQEDLFNFLASRSLDGGVALRIPTSPQRNAFRFLAESPEIMPFEEPLIDCSIDRSNYFRKMKGFS